MTQPLMQRFVVWLMGVLETVFPKEKHEPLPPEEQIFPDDGVLYAPDIPESYRNSRQIEFFCRLHVGKGDRLSPGLPYGEVDTSFMIFELIAPCEGVVTEVLVDSDGQIESSQPIIRIRAL